MAGGLSKGGTDGDCQTNHSRLETWVAKVLGRSRRESFGEQVSYRKNQKCLPGRKCDA